MLKKTVKLYYDANKNLTPLIRHTRKPSKNDSDKKYHEICYTEAQILDHIEKGGNVGIVINKKDVIIDIDIRNGGLESFKRLCKQIGQEIVPTVQTASGGFHCYGSMDEKFIGKTFKPNVPEYPGIDFLTYKKMCVIAGCSAHFKYAKTDPRYAKTDPRYAKTEEEAPLGHYIFSDPLATKLQEFPFPDCLMDIFLERNSDTDNDNWVIENEFAPWTEERLVKTLYDISPDIGYDTWYKVGMAMQSSGRDNWLELWKNWSKTGDSYTNGICEEVSVSFKKDDGITLGTLDYIAYGSKKDKVDSSMQKVSCYLEEIMSATESTLRGQICPQIVKDGLHAIDLAKIESCLQARLKELWGTKPSINAVREMIKPFGQPALTGLVEGFDGKLRPEWCNNWIYVQGHNCFVNINNLKEYRTEGFNLTNGIHVPVSTTGTKQSAMKYISDNGLVPEVNSLGYFPDKKELILTWGNEKMINMFNHKAMPEAAKEYSPRGLACVELITRHIKAVFSDTKDSEIFTCWLAHQVQHPGKKLLWVPVIQSVEGIGKSFFRELLQLCLGVSNVGVVNPSQVVSQFNGWACRKLVNVLEELKVTGHNRHEAANALKSLITDSTIQINEKGIRPYVTNNTVNYLCFTNYKDFLPVTDKDRRWWITFSPFENKDEMAMYLGEDIDKYFITLFQELRICSSEVLKWLGEYVIPKWFMEIKNAPMTESKKLLIATEESSYEGFEEAKALLEEGGVYFNQICLSSVDFFEKLEHVYIDFRPNNQEKNNILKRLGYSKLPKNIKVDNKMRLIWAKKSMEAEKVREVIGIKTYKTAK